MTFHLTEDAVHGIFVNKAHHDIVSKLSTEVKLGRITPKAIHPQPLQLADYFNPQVAKVSGIYPASTNRRAKCAVSLAQSYLNLELGCCVISMLGHAFGIWSGNQSNEIVMSDTDILTNYHSICGPGDPGCELMTVLGASYNNSFLSNGKPLQIGTPLYCLYQGRSDLVKAAIYCFGCTLLAFHICDGWMASAVWDSSNYSWDPDKGHAVPIIDFDEGGVYVASWGRIYYLTWAGLDCLPAGFITEHVVTVAPTWYNLGNLNIVTGIDFAGLNADINSIVYNATVPTIPNANPGYSGSVGLGSVQYLVQVTNQTIQIDQGLFVNGDGTMYTGVVLVKDLNSKDLYLTVTNGEVASASATPPPPPPPPGTSFKFDFGTAGSPVASGYTKVTEATNYTVSQGYGFAAGTSPILSADRAIGSDLLRDFVYGPDFTFLVDVANGSYQVTVNLGDMGPYQHDSQGVFLNGMQVDTVSTVAGQVLQKVYKITVTTGQIIVHLKDMGGSDPNVVMESLEIEPA